MTPNTIKINDTRPTGWMCPACHKAHGPHVDTCPAPQAQERKTSPFVPPETPNLLVGSGVAGPFFTDPNVGC